MIVEYGKWALAADEIQWILYRRRSKERGGWAAISFVRSTKSILARCCREKGINDDTIGLLLVGLPDTFDEWIAAQSSQDEAQPGR